MSDFNAKTPRTPGYVPDTAAIKRRDKFIGAGLIALILAILSGGYGPSGFLFLTGMGCFIIAGLINTWLKKKGEMGVYGK